MTEEETLIAKGEDAEALLNSPAFDSTIQNLVSDCFHTFVTSDFKDNETRELSYHFYKATIGIVDTLKQSVSVLDEILKKNSQETE